MDITLKYNRVDAFGYKVYTEDVRESAKKTDLQVALRRLKKDYNAAVSIDNKSIFWDNYTDFTNGILTVRTFEDYNAYDTDKISYESYEAFKKRMYKQFESERGV